MQGPRHPNHASSTDYIYHCWEVSTLTTVPTLHVADGLVMDLVIINCKIQKDILAMQADYMYVKKTVYSLLSLHQQSFHGDH